MSADEADGAEAATTARLLDESEVGHSRIQAMIDRIGAYLSSTDRGRQLDGQHELFSLLRLMSRAWGKADQLDIGALDAGLTANMVATRTLGLGQVPALYAPLQGEDGPKKGKPADDDQIWIGRVYSAIAVDFLRKQSDVSLSVDIACAKVVRDVAQSLRRRGIVGFPYDWQGRKLKRYRADLSRGIDCGPGGKDGLAHFNFQLWREKVGNKPWSSQFYVELIDLSAEHFRLAYNPYTPPRRAG